MQRKYQFNLFGQHYYQDNHTAEYLANQMLQLKTRVLGRNYPGCSSDLYNLGLLNLSLGDYLRAKRFLVRALQIQKNENSRGDVIATLRTLATLHQQEKSVCAM